MKSAAIELPAKALRRRERRAERDYQVAMQEFERAAMDYENASKARKSELGSPPAIPKLTRFTCDDITLEALGSRLDENPRGLCLVVDEAAGWAASFGQYKSGRGGDEQKWLTMHGARGLRIDRKTGDRPYLFIPHAAVSVIGGIQPGVLRSVLSPERFASGFASRLLLVMPPVRPKVWSEADIPEDVEAELAAVFDQLLNLQMEPNDEGDLVPASVPLQRAAKDCFARYADKWNETMPEDDNVRATFAKLEGGAARFALILHCVRVVSGDARNPAAISVEDMEAGIVLARWFGFEAERVYAVLAGGDLETDRQELQRWVIAHGGSATARDLQRAKPKRYAKGEDAEAALQDLVDEGRGSWHSVDAGADGGRPKRLFVLGANDITPIIAENDEVLSIVNEANEAKDGPDWDDINAELRADGMASRGVF
jgi:hypothetical protein